MTTATGMQEAAAPSTKSSVLAIVARFAIAAALLVFVFKFSFLAYLANANPDLTLAFDGNHPVALLNIAEREIAALEKDGESGAAEAHSAEAPQNSSDAGRFAAPAVGQPSREGESSAPAKEGAEGGAPNRDARIAEARRMLTASLRSEPLNHRAVTLMGRLLELERAPPDDVFAFYELAERLAPRALFAMYRLMQRDIERGAHAAAGARADKIMRSSTLSWAPITAVLAKLAESPEGAEPIIRHLAQKPPWREAFFRTVSNYVTDARTPLTLLLGLRGGPHPPKDDELKHYLDFLMKKNLSELAYYTWLQFLSPDQISRVGLLMNGSFETQPSGFPFDWTIESSIGVISDIVPIPGNEQSRALRIEFNDARSDFRGVQQVIFLAPGRYKLNGRFRGELIGRRGLRWRVRCGNARGKAVAETPMHQGSFESWRSFELEVTVPAEDCTFQTLRLELDARSRSEQLVRGTFWYDDLELVAEK